MEPVANNIYENYSMDFSFIIHHAMREDGQWFRRVQYKDARYGYKWSKWRECSAPAMSGIMNAYRKARLPKCV